MSIFLENVEIDRSWGAFVNEPAVAECLMQIERKIAVDGAFTPSVHQVLRFLSVDLASIKVVILGQDPYPQSGVATGRAFEVGTLKAWNTPYKNVSLKNIVRAVYAAYHGSIVTYSDVVSAMKNEEFVLASPDCWFDALEKQGVLFLNRGFTCRIGSPGSHMEYWGEFTHKLLAYMTSVNHTLIWFIWGKAAAEAVDTLAINKIVSSHPMMCYDRKDDFLYDKNMFAMTKELVNWRG